MSDNYIPGLVYSRFASSVSYLGKVRVLENVSENPFVGLLLSLPFWGGVELDHYWPIVPVRMLMNDVECRAIGKMIDRGNRSTARKPAPMMICPPQIPYKMARAQTLIAAVGIRRLTA
jgi:hypothetical protein